MNKIERGSWMLALIGALILQSCKTYQYVPYFKDVPDSARLTIKTALYKPLIIQQGDLLNVNVMTIDPAANTVFNQSAAQGTATITPLQPTGAPYAVDKNGEIDLPLLGNFKAEGLTTDSLKCTIQMKANTYYKTPSVTVRFANLKVNVLGEVAKPGSYLLPGEKNTILDALSQAGDLTIFGKRQNVLLLRDSAGYTVMDRFSLNSKDLVKQNFYYLKQNDVIYVEPDKGKAGSLDADKTRIYALVVSVITLLIVIVSRTN